MTERRKMSLSFHLGSVVISHWLAHGSHLLVWGMCDVRCLIFSPVDTQNSSHCPWKLSSGVKNNKNFIFAAGGVSLYLCWKKSPVRSLVRNRTISHKTSPPSRVRHFFLILKYLDIFYVSRRFQTPRLRARSGPNLGIWDRTRVYKMSGPSEFGKMADETGRLILI